jgi:hypothetical protein
MECSADPQVANDTTCLFEYDNDSVIVNAGVTFLQQQEKVLIRIQQWKEMTGTNNYEPYGIAMDINVCDLMKNADSPMWTMVNSMLPNLKKSLKQALKPCPYEPGRVEVRGLKLPLSTFRKGLVQGKLRENIKIINGQRQTLYEVKLQVNHV